MKSLNETQSLVRKACIGAGFEVGCADDASHAAVWLIENGFDGVGTVSSALNAQTCTSQIDTKTKCVFENPSMVADGSTVIDLALAHDVKVELKNIDCPLMLLGLAGVAAQQFEVGFMLNYSEAGKILVQPTGVSKVGDALGRDCVVRKIEVAKLESGTTEKTAPTAFEAKAEDWELLLSYAAKTYVPSSEASRLSGAGAGLNDND